MSVFNTVKLAATKDWKVFKEYVKHSTMFDDVGTSLPINFYTVSGGEAVCPIIKKDNIVTGIFTTGSDELEKSFLTSSNLTKLKNIENGIYLYDYNKNKIIYAYSEKKLIGNKGDWVLCPPKYSNCKFSHLIGVDKKGGVHKIYHQTAPFADACYLAYQINLTFPKGEYSLERQGVKKVFEILAAKYGLAEPVHRQIESFINHSFNPYGIDYPEYTVSTEMLNMIFVSDEPTKAEAKKQNTKELSLFPNRYNDNPSSEWYDIYGDENFSFITLMELIGVKELPKVDTSIEIIKNMQIPGLNKVILNKDGHLYVEYDSRVISVDEIDEALVLPSALTLYIDVTKKGVM